MFYLLATVLLNTLLFSLFKLYSEWRIDNRQAIVVNYLVCVFTGCLVHGYMPVFPGVFSEKWFPWALLTGICFILMFNFIAWSTVHAGITTTTIANKLSLVIPVTFSILLYDEPFGWIKGIGILLAIPAVILVSRKGEASVLKDRLLLWAMLLFVFSGLLDTLVKYVEHFYLPDPASQAAYVIWTFLMAGLLGLLYLFFLYYRKGVLPRRKEFLAGIAMGIPNYFSIYFLVRLLKDAWLPSSADILLNNIGIVFFSVSAANLFFREKMTKARWLGLGLALLAIILVALSDMYAG